MDHYHSNRKTFWRCLWIFRCHVRYETRTIASQKILYKMFLKHSKVISTSISHHHCSLQIADCDCAAIKNTTTLLQWETGSHRAIEQIAACTGHSCCACCSLPMPAMAGPSPFSAVTNKPQRNKQSQMNRLQRPRPR